MALTTTQIAPIAALVAGILILIMPNVYPVHVMTENPLG